jgi:hypothetical protein
MGGLGGESWPWETRSNMGHGRPKRIWRLSCWEKVEEMGDQSHHHGEIVDYYYYCY